MPSKLSVLSVCFAALIAVAPLQASTPAVPGAFPAKADLSEADNAALRTLFERLGEGFLSGDAEEIAPLLAPGPERARLIETLKREFSEARYLDFQIAEILPEYKISPRRHSVDVTLRLKLLYLDDSRPADARKPIENTTIQSFIVHRLNSGQFLIANSSFFDNMGKRHGGMRLFVDGLAAIIILCAVLAFWVWMGSDAWWMRPRSTFWRGVVLIPVIGALIFFAGCYVPMRLKGVKGPKKPK
jgi:hypothetical protein